jgi:hypothetical protein
MDVYDPESFQNIIEKDIVAVLDEALAKLDMLEHGDTTIARDQLVLIDGTSLLKRECIKQEEKFYINDALVASCESIESRARLLGYKILYAFHHDEELMENYVKQPSSDLFVSAEVHMLKHTEMVVILSDGLRNAPPYIKVTNKDDDEIVFEEALVSTDPLHVDNLEPDTEYIVETEAMQVDPSTRNVLKSVITSFEPRSITIFVLLQENKVVLSIKSMRQSSHYEVGVAWKRSPSECVWHMFVDGHALIHMARDTSEGNDGLELYTKLYGANKIELRQDFDIPKDNFDFDSTIARKINDAEVAIKYTAGVPPSASGVLRFSESFQSYDFAEFGGSKHVVLKTDESMSYLRVGNVHNWGIGHAYRNHIHPWTCSCC